MKGQPDLIIQNLHKHYNGLCIEFKTPQCNGIITDQQKELIERYEENGYKCIVSNDYDLITKELNATCTIFALHVNTVEANSYPRKH